METRKYILTEKTKKINNHILHRIKAVANFGDVNEGELGGWVESEDNLSQEGECWVNDNACVYGNARVSHHAQIFGDAKVYGKATIFGEAKVYGKATIFSNAIVRDHATIAGNAKIYGNAYIRESCFIYGNAKVYGDATLGDNVFVYGNVRISGRVVISGRAEICGDAEIRFDKDYSVYKNSWSSGRYFTWTRSNNMWKVGCFYGTGEELIAKAYNDSEKSGRCYEIIVKTQEALSNVK